jgi:hypothetical protein
MFERKKNLVECLPSRRKLLLPDIIFMFSSALQPLTRRLSSLEAKYFDGPL